MTVGRGAARVAAYGAPRRHSRALLGNPEVERHSLLHAWVKNGDKATSPVAHYPVTEPR